MNERGSEQLSKRSRSGDIRRVASELIYCWGNFSCFDLGMRLSAMNFTYAATDGIFSGICFAVSFRLKPKNTAINEAVLASPIMLDFVWPDIDKPQDIRQVISLTTSELSESWQPDLSPLPKAS